MGNVTKYMVVLKNEMSYTFEIETNDGPMDAQAIATAKMQEEHPMKQELIITTERMTA